MSPYDVLLNGSRARSRFSKAVINLQINLHTYAHVGMNNKSDPGDPLTCNMTDNQIRETPPEKVPEQQGSNYQVIAGKYRPLNFSNLIGQELMVRTLTKLLRPNFF